MEPAQKYTFSPECPKHHVKLSLQADDSIQCDHCLAERNIERVGRRASCLTGARA